MAGPSGVPCAPPDPEIPARSANKVFFPKYEVMKNFDVNNR